MLGAQCGLGKKGEAGSGVETHADVEDGLVGGEADGATC